MRATRAKSKVQSPKSEVEMAEGHGTRNTHHATPTRTTVHDPRPRIPQRLLRAVAAAVRAGADEQADAGDGAVRPAAAGLLAALQNAECGTTPHASSFTSYASVANRNRRTQIADPLLPFLWEKVSVPVAQRGLVRCHLPGAAKRRSGAGCEQLPGRRARGQRVDVLCALPGQDGLAGGSGGALLAEGALALVAGGSGGSGSCWRSRWR